MNVNLYSWQYTEVTSFQGNHCARDWRYEGQGRSWRGISVCRYVGCPGCGWALQAAWHHCSAHQAEGHWWQQVMCFHIEKMFHDLFSCFAVSLWLYFTLSCSKSRTYSMRNTRHIQGLGIILTIWNQTPGFYQCGSCMLAFKFTTLIHIYLDTNFWVASTETWIHKSVLQDQAVFCKFLIVEAQGKDYGSALRRGHMATIFLLFLAHPICMLDCDLYSCALVFILLEVVTMACWFVSFAFLCTAGLIFMGHSREGLNAI